MQPIPTVNVNLKPCEHWCRVWRISDPPQSTHDDGCPGAPVLVPLSLEPWRSVTMTVRLGECRCNARSPVSIERLAGEHNGHCPARPVEVVCSISGKDWPRSEVDEFEITSGVPVSDFWAVERAVRARWAGIVNLVTGMVDATTDEHWLPFVARRDAVYASLADMARHESGVWDALQRAFKAIPEGRTLRASNREPLEAPSAIVLMGYVQRLIEQVGIL